MSKHLRLQDPSKRPPARLLWLGIIFLTAGFASLIFADHLKPSLLGGERILRIATEIESKGLTHQLIDIWQDWKHGGVKSGEADADIKGDSKTATAIDARGQIWSIFETEARLLVRENRISSLVEMCGYMSILIGLASICGYLFGQSGEHEFLVADNLPTVSSDSTLASIVGAQLAKAGKLRGAAHQLIALIFILAIGGMTLFYLSGEFSYEKRASNIGILKEALENIADRNEDAQERVTNMFRDAIDGIADTEEDSQVKVALLQAAASHAAQFGEFAKADQGTRQLETSLNRNVLISSIAARAGIILIVGYLIKILLSSYRYNIRLAAFYSSRAYSLLLLPQEKLPNSLAEIVASLGPESLDFEKANASDPISGVEELRKAIGV